MSYLPIFAQFRPSIKEKLELFLIQNNYSVKLNQTWHRWSPGIVDTKSSDLFKLSISALESGYYGDLQEGK